MEIRLKESEEKCFNETDRQEKYVEEMEKIEILLQSIISLWIGSRIKSIHLIHSYQFLHEQYHRYQSIQKIFPSMKMIRGKRKFRSFVYFILSMKRFDRCGKESLLHRISSTSNLFFYQIQFPISPLKFIHSMDFQHPFQSFIQQINRFYSSNNLQFNRSIVKSFSSSSNIKSPSSSSSSSNKSVLLFFFFFFLFLVILIDLFRHWNRLKNCSFMRKI